MSVVFNITIVISWFVFLIGGILFLLYGHALHLIIILIQFYGLCTLINLDSILDRREIKENE